MTKGARHSRPIQEQLAKLRLIGSRCQLPYGTQAAPIVIGCLVSGCPVLRKPRREADTICTAIAPEAIFTVRTYATRRDYEPISAQIHRSPPANLHLGAVRDDTRKP
jgi:hypothetical protein